MGTGVWLISYDEKEERKREAGCRMPKGIDVLRPPEGEIRGGAGPFIVNSCWCNCFPSFEKRIPDDHGLHYAFWLNLLNASHIVIY